jgi:purine-nucleoside phosphorylase
MTVPASMPASESPDKYQSQVEATADWICSRLRALPDRQRATVDPGPSGTAGRPVGKHGPPPVGIILGSGLGGFVEALTVERRIPYSDLPGWPVSTAIGHAGRLVSGRLENVPLLVMQGRCHLYEGYSLDDVTFPVRVLHRLGVERLIVSCAAGGLHPRFSVGDLMLIRQHINLLRERSSVETGSDPEERSGVGTFPAPLPSSAPYDDRFAQRLLEIARRQNVPLVRGTYVAVTGPNYETRAELRFLRQIADAVGMSTVPEATVAHDLGMRVCGLATITNLCRPDRPAETLVDAEHVIQAAAQAEPRFRALVREFLVSPEIRAADNAE